MNQIIKDFLANLGLQDISFPVNNHTLFNAETIIDKTSISNTKLIEKILNLSNEKQTEIIDQLLDKPNINIELACNKNLDYGQFTEHIRISAYNYEVEHGNLKDSDYLVVNNSLINDENLTANQLYQIHNIVADVGRSKNGSQLLKNGIKIEDNTRVYGIPHENIKGFIFFKSKNELSQNNLQSIQQNLKNKLDNVISELIYSEINKLDNKFIVNLQDNESVLKSFEAVAPELVKNIREVGYIDEPNVYIKLSQENPQELAKYLSDKTGIEYANDNIISSDINKNYSIDHEFSR